MITRLKSLKFRGFTLVEMLTVIAIIAILAGLVLSASGFVQRRGAIARAEAEIAALSAAIERYKGDNGDIPRSADTDALNATAVSPSSYTDASKLLFNELSGFGTNSVRPTGAVSYFDFKPGQVSTRDPNANNNSIVDPFGYSYGYSTLGSSSSTNNLDKTNAYNPTFDLWSTAGKTQASGTAAWIKNW